MQLGSFASSGRPEELDGHPGRQHEPVQKIVARKRPKLEPFIEPPCPQPCRVDHDNPGCHMVEDSEAAVLCFCGPGTVRHASPALQAASRDLRWCPEPSDARSRRSVQPQRGPRWLRATSKS